VIPNGWKQIVRVYGNPGDPGWASKHLVTIRSPKFRTLPRFNVRCHRLVAEEISVILQEIATAEISLSKSLIESYDGCWVHRKQRGGQKLSTHALGIAIDLNAFRNALGETPCQSEAMVKCFTRRGWVWGGTWNRPDGMHFQRAKGY